MLDQEINSCTVLCGPSCNTVLTYYEDHGVYVRCIYSLSIYFMAFPNVQIIFSFPSISLCFANANRSFPR